MTFDEYKAMAKKIGFDLIVNPIGEIELSYAGMHAASGKPDGVGIPLNVLHALSVAQLGFMAGVSHATDQAVKSMRGAK